MAKDLKIGIIGLGFLGGAMHRYFSEQGFSVYCYDKNGTGSPEEVNKADVVFISVNTPYDQKKKEADLSYIESAVKIIGTPKVIVFRSTIPPGTTENMQKRFPEHKFLFVPEFLRAKFADEDFRKPPRQIVGFTVKSKTLAQTILDLFPKAPVEYTKVLPATSAELIKYAANTILAVKVALANKIFELSNAIGVDYDEVKHLIGADQRIGHYGLEVFYEGFRGYNSGCFPKDIRTFIVLGEKLGVDMQWLRLMDDENINLLKNQGLEPNYGYPKVEKNKTI